MGGELRGIYEGESNHNQIFGHSIINEWDRWAEEWIDMHLARSSWSEGMGWDEMHEMRSHWRADDGMYV